jgi:cation diffusion facilitator CzcD-associated flavoprotein CzcO
MEEIFDTIVIGGGQSGLACGYYLRRAKLNFLILDKQPVPGGAWLNAWDSLTLFSPSEYSSLPGWLMPKSNYKFPLRKEVIDYLTKYENRYEMNIKRKVEVIQISKDNGVFQIHSNQGIFKCKTIISATGTWGNPFIPKFEGIENFKGLQIHSRHYKNPEEFIGLKTLVVGEGNSGAQILAEISEVTTAKWSTRTNPEFLPDEVDGYYLFNLASAKYKAEQEGKPFDASQYNLGNIVMVPSVKAAQKRGVLVSSGAVSKLTEKGVIWDSGLEEEFDAIIWCTGFGYDTVYLKSLVKTDHRGIAATRESKSVEVDGLWLVRYGGWTGYSSATLIGVSRTAKQTSLEIKEYLTEQNGPINS